MFHHGERFLGKAVQQFVIADCIAKTTQRATNSASPPKGGPSALIKNDVCLKVVGRGWLGGLPVNSTF